MASPPRLARGVTITRRQISEEEIYYLVKDPQAGSFLRVGEVEAALLRLLDGTHTTAEVSELLKSEHGFNVGVPIIEDFLGSLIQRGLVESRSFDPEAFRKEWLSQERARRRSLGSLLGTLAIFKMKLLNPQALFTRLIGPLGFLWTRAFVVSTLILMALAALMASAHHEEIARSTWTFYHSATSSAGSFASHAAIIYGVLFLVVAVHESSHGLTCTRFGGKVTDMGFILFYLQVPGFYCDVTDAYSFEKRSHRLWTTIAGGYSGLVMASFGVFLWWAT
ncbi:MAG TPA: hypothetical protein VJ826_01820, partial [Candidatus Polarisedimenticolaceae bacterium]|nr:hypothetical protein [Candidatus Polarisedimenticolaceae bacterium]